MKKGQNITIEQLKEILDNVNIADNVELEDNNSSQLEEMNRAVEALSKDFNKKQNENNHEKARREVAKEKEKFMMLEIEKREGWHADAREEFFELKASSNFNKLFDNAWKVSLEANELEKHMNKNKGKRKASSISSANSSVASSSEAVGSEKNMNKNKRQRKAISSSYGNSSSTNSFSTLLESPDIAINSSMRPNPEAFQNIEIAQAETTVLSSGESSLDELNPGSITPPTTPKHTSRAPSVKGKYLSNKKAAQRGAGFGR